MVLSLSHQKNPAVGWDIIASAKAEKDEKISRVQILVNDFSAFDKSFNPPLNSWQQLLIQQGEYPGDNTVQLIVTDEKDQETEADDSWSS